MNPVERWRELLESWAIPPAILAAAPESPYGFPAALFRTRGAQDADPAEPTPTTLRALERLPEGGRVLDVGCGGGATSLPLAGHVGVLVGVDAQEDMLDGFLANARAAGVHAEAVHGGWPEVAGTIAPVDVAVAGHVLYNVADLEPFVRAIAGAARRGVVFELTDRHPLAWMSDLWLRFHDVERPLRPDVRRRARCPRRDRARPADRALGGTSSRRRVRSTSRRPRAGPTTPLPVRIPGRGARGGARSSARRARGAVERGSTPPGARDDLVRSLAAESDRRHRCVDLVLGILDPRRLADPGPRSLGDRHPELAERLHERAEILRTRRQHLSHLEPEREDVALAPSTDQDDDPSRLNLGGGEVTARPRLESRDAATPDPTGLGDPEPTIEAPRARARPTDVVRVGRPTHHRDRPSDEPRTASDLGSPRVGSPLGRAPPEGTGSNAIR